MVEIDRERPRLKTCCVVRQGGINFLPHSHTGQRRPTNHGLDTAKPCIADCCAFSREEDEVKHLHRGLALGVVAAWIATCLSPLLIALVSLDSESNLPACCRRDGKHRCAASTHIPVTGTAFSSPRRHCPFFPHGVTTPSSSTGYSLPSTSFHGSLECASALVTTGEARCRLSLNRCYPKRGPPLVIPRSSQS